MPVNEDARPERLRRLADYATLTEKSMALRVAADEIECLRAALAARPQPVAWLDEAGLHNLQRARRQGHSHYTVQVRTDRADDYFTIPVVAGSATPTQGDCTGCGMTYAECVSVQLPAIRCCPECHHPDAAAGSATPTGDDE